MGVPKQIKKQVEDAEALAKELGLEPATETPIEPAEVVDITPTEPVGEAPPPVEPVGEAPPPVEPVAAPPVEPTAEDKAEQKFKTLQGKYNAETQALKDQVGDLRSQIETQNAVLASMQQPAPAAEPAPTPTEKPATVISEAEVSDYGEELLDIIGRKSLLSINPALEQINQRLQSLEQGLGGVQQKAVLSDREKVYAALNELVPTWKAVNKSTDFRAWLTEADPSVGAQRGALLNQAFDENATDRVVAFFKGYLNEQTTVQTVETVPTPAATPDSQAAQVDLETLVSPGGAQEATPASAHGDTAGRMYTQTEIAAFYSDVQKGKYKGKDAEKLAVEQDIIAAANTGRIR